MESLKEKKNEDRNRRQWINCKDGFGMSAGSEDPDSFSVVPQWRKGKTAL
jgi:hypothetical protein